MTYSDFFTAGDALDIVEQVAERLLPVLPSRPRHMWCRDDVRQGERLVLGCGRLLDHDIAPRNRPATTFSCCQTSRRDTASVNGGAC
jgi:hypothetical protein